MTFVVAFVLGAGAFLLHMRPPSTEAIGYYLGVSCLVVAPLSVFVGVPVLAWRHRVGFWRGLLGVVIAAGWLALISATLVALVGPGRVLALFVATGLNFLIAVVFGMILRRRRRARRGMERIGDAFS